MNFNSKKRIIFLGFNNMFKHKRGVENVIDFQSKANSGEINYYLHWDNETKVYRYGRFLCISIKKSVFWFVTLNVILMRIKRRDNKLFIHSHNPLMSIVSVFQSNLFTVHDGLYYLCKSGKHPLKNLFFVLEKILYLRVGYVHFISNYAKSESLFPKIAKNFVIIPNTSHIENLLLKFKKSKTADGFYLFSPDRFKILVVRSIEERARIDLIIKVALSLINKNIEIIVAGKGPLLDQYREIIIKNNLTNVKLLGYVDDENLISLYQECDIVLMPAEYGEGFGLPIIEGYLFNKPVIASNKCAIPEFIFSEDYLFENNSESILDKIEFFKNSEKNNFREYYQSRFSNKKIIEEMSLLYNLLRL